MHRNGLSISRKRINIPLVKLSVETKLSFTIILMVVLITVGCAREEFKSINIEAASLNAEGLQLITGGHYDGAIEKLKAAVEKDPGNKAYVTNLAFAYYRSERFDEAVVQFERAASIDPSDALIFLDYGRCLKRAGRIDQALQKLQEAAKLGEGNPKLPVILLEISLCYENLGMPDQSIETLRMAIEEVPHAEYYTRLADLLLDTGDIEAAEVEYRNAIDIAPNYAPAMNNLGLLLTANDRKAEGIKMFEMVLGRDPYNGPALNNLALEYWETDDLESAIKAIKAAIRSEPSNALYHYHLAMFLKDSGEDQEAIEELLVTLQYDPNYPDALLKLEEWQG